MYDKPIPPELLKKRIRNFKSLREGLEDNTERERLTGLITELVSILNEANS